jgi:hypothetical protein
MNQAARIAKVFRARSKVGYTLAGVFTERASLDHYCPDV